MTQIAPFRKAVFLCAAVMAAAAVSGCDNSNLGEAFAKIKSIQVDDKGVPADSKLSKADVDLALNTAKDLAVGKDGLLQKDASGNLKIAVVDPLKVPPPDDGARLDERSNAKTYTIAQLEAMRALPDLPIAAAADAANNDAPVAVVAPPVVRTVVQSRVGQSPGNQTQASQGQAPVGTRVVQVGSFASVAAAQQAWTSLQARYPGVARYNASYQKITTAAGKPMVRLKVGPVSNDGQAKALCGQLDINDAWCAKAG